MAVLRLEFPHVLVGGFGVVDAHLLQDLLQVHLASERTSSAAETGRHQVVYIHNNYTRKKLGHRVQVSQSRCAFSLHGELSPYRRLFGDVDQVLEGVVLVVLEGGEEEVVDHLALVAGSLELVWLLLSVAELKSRARGREEKGGEGGCQRSERVQ